MVTRGGDSRLGLERIQTVILAAETEIRGRKTLRWITRGCKRSRIGGTDASDHDVGHGDDRDGTRGIRTEDAGTAADVDRRVRLQSICSASGQCLFRRARTSFDAAPAAFLASLPVHLSQRRESKPQKTNSWLHSAARPASGFLQVAPIESAAARTLFRSVRHCLPRHSR